VAVMLFFPPLLIVQYLHTGYWFLFRSISIHMISEVKIKG
jgi:hypothetical protein